MHSNGNGNSEERERQVREIELKLGEQFGFPVAVHSDKNMRFWFTTEGDADWTKALVYLLSHAEVSMPRMYYDNKHNYSELSITIHKLVSDEEVT